LTLSSAPFSLMGLLRIIGPAQTKFPGRDDFFDDPAA
jgi:hypothetical protein